MILVPVAVVGYLVVGAGIAIVGIRRGWGLFSTELERRPDAALLLLFWPIVLVVYGFAWFLEWITTIADPVGYKRKRLGE